MTDAAETPTLASRRLTVAGGLAVSVVTCAGACRGWAPAEEACGPALVFVRRGSFVRRANGVESLHDATLAYFALPGTEEQFAHPAGQHDECLSIGLPPGLLSELGRSPGDLPEVPVYTPAAIDLGHRMLAVEAGRGGDEFDLHERAARLVAAVLERLAEERPARRPATASARRRLVSRAREVLLGDPSIGLVELARQAGGSPHHLSRVFSGETGQTLSAYRNRLRLGIALAHLEDGERDLTGLAVELGFADHAHMTRVARVQLGVAPSRVRHLLTPAN
jgi:AraC-like DNA-binding protein